MLFWFAVLGLLGLGSIVDAPGVLAAINPSYALSYILDAGPVLTLAVLAAVFLSVTGGEALYADMGHFGRFPIRAAWFTVVLPALVLNYFGQGALLLTDPSALENPFYELAPDWAALPARASCDRRNRDRLAGRDHRGVLADPAGDPARPFAPPAGDPDGRRGEGPDLHPVHQLGPRRADARRGLGFGSSSKLAGAYGLPCRSTW